MLCGQYYSTLAILVHGHFFLLYYIILKLFMDLYSLEDSTDLEICQLFSYYIYSSFKHFHIFLVVSATILLLIVLLPLAKLNIKALKLHL